MSYKRIISFNVNPYGVYRQESVAAFLSHQDTCYLEIRPSKRDDENSRPGLFCCGEHFGFIGYPSEESMKIARAFLYKTPLKVENITSYTAYGLLDDTNLGIIQRIDVSYGGDVDAQT